MLDLLEETGKLTCKPAKTPIEQNHQTAKASEDVAVDKGMYQRLIYLSHTRSDMAYAVGVISQFMHSSSLSKVFSRKGYSLKKGN